MPEVTVRPARGGLTGDRNLGRTERQARTVNDSNVPAPARVPWTWRTLPCPGWLPDDVRTRVEGFNAEAERINTARAALDAVGQELAALAVTDPEAAQKTAAAAARKSRALAVAELAHGDELTAIHDAVAAAARPRKAEAHLQLRERTAVIETTMKGFNAVHLCAQVVAGDPVAQALIDKATSNPAAGFVLAEQEVARMAELRAWLQTQVTAQVVAG